MKATSREQAWEMANEIFPTDYEKAEKASARAGYDIYMKNGDRAQHSETEDWVLASWISDLGNRLEINLASGKTINIWIEIPVPRFSEAAIGDVLSMINDFVYEVDDMISSELQEATGLKDARNKAYAAYAIIAKMLKKDFPNSKLYDQYNLKDA